MSHRLNQAAGQLHLYFRHAAAMPAEEERSILDSLSASESARLEAIKSPGRQLEYLVSRRLMRQALSEQFGAEAQGWRFEERRGEPPSVPDLPPGQHITLSHSKGLICFALADTEVGVDIEACRHQRDYARLARMFMTEAERDELTRRSDHAAFFYRCWCAKEAYYKAHSKADQNDLHFSGIEVAELDRGNDWYLIEGRVGEHYLVVATQQRDLTTHCHYLPGETTWSRPFEPANA